jgi:WD40 repeat protein
MTGHRSLITPSSFGDYELIEEIARGGMGVVYKARQVSLDRLVAVKMILAGEFATPQFVQRFRTEAAAAAVLHHPNIVAIHEVGVNAGQHYFSMDFVAGPNLAALVGHQPLPARRVAQYLKTIAEAIHYAHEQGILHRDLKPSNVLIDANDQPRITDFGLAKRLTGKSEMDLTLSGQVLGSPNFMPPEQASGKHGKVGRYSDVYALGGILYHLLTARPPFQADSLEIIVSQVLTAEPVSPRMLNPTVPRDLETICLKCLEKEPSRRYATAQTLADELGRFRRGEPILARPASQPERAWRWCRRQPVRAGLIAALVLVFVLGFSGVVWQWQRAERQRFRAEDNELFARQNAYAADMNLAQRAHQDNNVGLATSLLNKHRLGAKSEIRNPKSEIDLRGWEWRYLWQLCQSDESVRLQTNSGSIGAVAISQDGRVMAVQTGGDKVVVWDLISKRPMAELPSSDSIEILGLSPNGSLLAVSTRDARREPMVEVWDVQARKISRTLNHPSPVRSLAFSPDGTLLATFDNQGTIALVEWAANHTLTNLSVLPPRHGGAGVVDFSPDGSRLAIGEDYGRIRILNWRAETTVSMTHQTQTGDGVMALAFSPTTGLLATGFGYSSGTIRLWDVSSGEPRGQLTNHTDQITALTFTPDGQLLASASADRTIQIWSVADQVELRRWRGHEGEGMALAFLPNGKTLVSGCQERAACYWDLSATNLPPAHTRLAISYGPGSQAVLAPPSFAREPLDPKVVRRFGFAFTPDGRNFITSDREGSLGFWDARSVRLMERLPALGSNHWGVALSPDGHWLAAGNAAGKVNLWDWSERRLVKSLEVPFEWFGDLRFSRSGKFLLGRAAENDQTVSVRIWRTNDWAEAPLTGSQSAALWSADLSPDDRLLATGYSNGAVKLWDFPSGEHEMTITNHTGALLAVLFSPDGRVLASASHDGQVGLWDVFARRELATLRGHLGSVWSAAFSPDGRRLATGGSGAKDAVKLWDLATQREILSLQGEGDFFFHVAFSPDGSTVMATSFTGVAHLWRAPSWTEIAAAEKKQRAP